MSIKFPQTDLAVGVRGGSDSWDDGLAGALLLADYFDAEPQDSTGTLDATESGSDTLASSGAVLVSGGLSVAESGADSLVSSGGVRVGGSLAVTESGADSLASDGSTFPETEPTSQNGFTIVDHEPASWWKRKPRSMPEQVAKQKIKRAARVIEQIARKPIPEQQRIQEVRQAIGPMLVEMPGFAWQPVYQYIVANLGRQQAEAARLQAIAEIDRIRAIESDEDDVLVLLLSGA